ncbi:hypothetical protein M4A92_07925, partial [Caldibacillus thermoamylovorans]|nr:hypothetical protein [Caldibacillus thermoamylovorans]
MGKRLLILLVFVFSISSNQVLAHTSLEDSTPKDGQVITEPIQELILIFGTKIEQSSNLKVSSLNVSPHSNNAYKSTAPLVKIDISIKGGAFHMPEQKLTIVPVTL